MKLSVEEKEKLIKALKVVEQYNPELWYRSIIMYVPLIFCSCEIPFIFHIQNEKIKIILDFIIPFLLIILMTIKMMKVFQARDDFYEASEYINSIVPLIEDDEDLKF